VRATLELESGAKFSSR